MNHTNEHCQEIAKPISVLSYFHILVISFIPLLGLFYSIVWSFHTNTEKNKKNLARAILMVQLLTIFIFTVLILYVWNHIVIPSISIIKENSIPSYTDISNSILENTIDQIKNSDNMIFFNFFN